MFLQLKYDSEDSEEMVNLLDDGVKIQDPIMEKLLVRSECGPQRWETIQEHGVAFAAERAVLCGVGSGFQEGWSLRSWRFTFDCAREGISEVFRIES